MKSGLYVCIKEITDRATGYDMPTYVLFPKGVIAYFEETPDAKHWEALSLQGQNDIILSSKESP